MSLLEVSWMLDDIVNGNWAIPEKCKRLELAKVDCGRRVENKLESNCMPTGREPQTWTT